MFMVNELEQKAYSTAKIEKPMWEQVPAGSFSLKDQSISMQLFISGGKTPYFYKYCHTR
jgi:hypothetical protein